MDLLVRRFQNLVDLSYGPGDPLPDALRVRLRDVLSYTHRVHTGGYSAYREESAGVPLMERRTLAKEEGGRLQTTLGLLTRLVTECHSLGYGVRYSDLSPPRANPACYELDWAAADAVTDWRPGQREACQAVAANERGLLIAATGFGKTHLFTPLSHLFSRAKIDFVVGPTDVARDAQRALTKTLPNVGLVGAGQLMHGNRVTVVTAGSVHHREGQSPDLVICDEAHQYGSSLRYNKLLSIYGNCRIFGLTASPRGRSDGADLVLEMLFGRPIFELPYPLAQLLGLVVPIHVDWIYVRGGAQLSQQTSVARNRWGIWRNEVRNSAIARHLQRHYGDPETQVLVMVATLDHAVHLRQYLPDYEICYGGADASRIEEYQRAGLLPDDFIPVDAVRRERMRDAFAAGDLKKVIATDIWGTGVSFNKLQVLVRADGRGAEIPSIQLPGRVSRLSEGKSQGIVVDCYDDFDKTMRSRSLKRRTCYRRAGWSESFPTGRTARDGSGERS